MTRNEELFETFLEKYCTKHKITREEALKHIQVQVTKDLYEEEEYTREEPKERTKVSEGGSCEESRQISILISGGC